MFQDKTFFILTYSKFKMWSKNIHYFILSIISCTQYITVNLADFLVFQTQLQIFMSCQSTITYTTVESLVKSDTRCMFIL